MSRFLSKKFEGLVPYVPGEQPRDMKYLKLNTNESPFDVPESVVRAASDAAETLRLYSDPDCRDLLAQAAETFGVPKDSIVFVNGSDEILNFALMAYCDETHPAVFPNITYGFYPVMASLNRAPYEEIPLEPDLSIDTAKYKGLNKTIFIPNPNAPTGVALTRAQVEEIVSSNPGGIVVIDEAYVDFGAESSLALIEKYDNLLVTQTFSKSRSMAGARIGMGFGNPELIKDLNTIRYSTNPYNINRMTSAAAVAMLKCQDEMKKNCGEIVKNREFTVTELGKLGFEMTDSSANFVFAKHAEIGGGELYLKLKERGILIRHFTRPEIKDYNRITIGTRNQMQTLIDNIKAILEADR